MSENFLDTITAQHSNNLPFVVYRKPKEKNIIALLQDNDRLNHLTDFTESGFVFAPFDIKNNIVLLHGDRRLEVTPNSFDPDTKKYAELSLDKGEKDFHLNLVKTGINKILEGEFDKVVLSRKIEVDCKTSSLNLFQKLLVRNPHAFCYLWYHPKVGTWLGATPEILLKGENQRIITMSLAGTQEYNGSEPIEWGAKELEEQELVTNYISNMLKDKVTNLSVSERESVRAGNLLHLRTKLTANYEKERLGEIVNALHPTPAVCGMPLKPTKEFILRNEDYDREYYTGYLGELNVKSENAPTSRRSNVENRAYKSLRYATTFFVNLRCMQLKQNKVLIYVGGGVTKDSDPEKEWEETVAKTNTMLEVVRSD